MMCMMKLVKSVSAHQECLNEADNRQHQKGRKPVRRRRSKSNRNVREVIGQKRYRRNQRNRIDPTTQASAAIIAIFTSRQIYLCSCCSLFYSSFLEVSCKAFQRAFAAALMRRQGDSESVRFLKQSV